jgi:FAD/FMN-containing dehydrogenase
MDAIEAFTLDRRKATVAPAALEALRNDLRGDLLLPGEPGYDDARTIWNAMVNRKPALIARCRGVADVIRAVAFAGEHELLLAIKGGGHNIAGNSLCDGGMVIDLSLMKSVRVDPKARRAWVEPGATLGDVDHETQAFGLATPTGINSTTGIAGLTLGGGFGWITRKHGLTCDNLVSADVVTADGKLVHASAKENADLFWALRGGGGNFGVVTCFEFQLHPIGPEVFAGLVVYPFDQAQKVLRAYRDWTATLPDEATVWVVMRKAPPLPFLPTEVHGREAVVLAMLYAGDPKQGEKVLAPARGFGKPWGEHVGVMPFAAWQQAFDPLLTPGARNYWKSHNFSSVPDVALDVLIDATTKLPSPHCEVFLGLLGGQAGRTSPAEDAWAHRDANFVVNVHGRWEKPEEDKRGIAWARELFTALTPHATGGVYVNFMTDDEKGRVQSAYGASYTRLATIKKRYDPENVFRMNHNIAPA